MNSRMACRTLPGHGVALADHEEPSAARAPGRIGILSRHRVPIERRHPGSPAPELGLLLVLPDVVTVAPGEHSQSSGGDRRPLVFAVARKLDESRGERSGAVSENAFHRLAGGDAEIAEPSMTSAGLAAGGSCLGVQMGNQPFDDGIRRKAAGLGREIADQPVPETGLARAAMSSV